MVNFVTRANFNLKDGCMKLNTLSSKVLFKIVVMVGHREEEQTILFIDHALATAHSTALRHAQAVMGLCAGSMTVEAALKTSEMEVTADMIEDGSDPAAQEQAGSQAAPEPSSLVERLARMTEANPQNLVCGLCDENVACAGVRVYLNHVRRCAARIGGYDFVEEPEEKKEEERCAMEDEGEATSGDGDGGGGDGDGDGDGDGGKEEANTEMEGAGDEKESERKRKKIENAKEEQKLHCPSGHGLGKFITPPPPACFHCDLCHTAIIGKG